MQQLFVGAAARALTASQFRVLFSLADGPRPFVAEGPHRLSTDKMISIGLVIRTASSSPRGLSARRNGGRFLRLTASGRAVLEQALALRAPAIPVTPSPSIQPAERTENAIVRVEADAEAVR